MENFAYYLLNPVSEYEKDLVKLLQLGPQGSSLNNNFAKF